jgi:hypothetical protein
MIFINPKTDFAFKKIFGSGQSHGILISFLNGILYEGQSIVKDLTILDPYLSPRIRGVKIAIWMFEPYFKAAKPLLLKCRS